MMPGPAEAAFELDDDRRQALQWLFLVPAFFAAALTIVPSFSIVWAGVAAAAVVGDLAIQAVFHLRGGYRSRLAVELFATFQVDLTALLVTVLAWRVTRGAVWLLVVFVALLVLAAVGAYVWKEAVLQELEEPRTLLGKGLLAALALTSAGGAGALGYAYGDAGGGGWAVSIPLLALAIGFVLWRQSLWLRVERPDWQPQPRSAASRHDRGT